jgi:hypothetical protein
VSLRKKLVASPLPAAREKPAPAEKPMAAQVVQRGGECVLTDGKRHRLPPECGEWTKDVTAARMGYKDKVKSISFPGGVTAVGVRGYQELKALESVAFLTSLVSIGDHAFHLCRTRLRVVIPTVHATRGTLYQFIRELGHSLLEVVIPAGCKSIGQCAFYNCKVLTQVANPERCVWRSGGELRWLQESHELDDPEHVPDHRGLGLRQMSESCQRACPDGMHVRGWRRSRVQGLSHAH